MLESLTQCLLRSFMSAVFVASIHVLQTGLYSYLFKNKLFCTFQNQQFNKLFCIFQNQQFNFNKLLEQSFKNILQTLEK